MRPSARLSGESLVGVVVLLLSECGFAGAQTPNGGAGDWIPPLVESQKKLAHDMVRMKGTATDVLTNPLAQLTRTSAIEFAFSDERLRYIETVGAEKVSHPGHGMGVGFTRGYVFNPGEHKDSFTFHKPHDQANNVLDEIEQGNSAKWQSLTSPLARRIRAPTSLADASLLDVVLHPSFKCLSATTATDQGRAVLRVTFEVAPTKRQTDPLREFEAAMGGWFQVSPDKGWRLEKYELIYANYSNPKKTATKLSEKGTIDYGDGPPGNLPFRTAVRETYGNGVMGARFELTLNAVSSEGVTDDLFDPAGFDFYSSQGTARRTRFWVVASVGAAALLLGLLLRYWLVPPASGSTSQTEVK